MKCSYTQVGRCDQGNINQGVSLKILCKENYKCAKVCENEPRNGEFPICFVPWFERGKE